MDALDRYLENWQLDDWRVIHRFWVWGSVGLLIRLGWSMLG